MLPHALKSNVFALEIQLQLRTDPGTAYGALVDHRWSPIVVPRPRKNSWVGAPLSTGREEVGGRGVKNSVRILGRYLLESRGGDAGGGGGGGGGGGDDGGSAARARAGLQDDARGSARHTAGCNETCARAGTGHTGAVAPVVRPRGGGGQHNRELGDGPPRGGGAVGGDLGL